MAIRLISEPPGRLPDPALLLGGSVLGHAPAVPPAWPGQHLSPLLPAAQAAGALELWASDTPCVSGLSEGIRWRRSGDLLFGVIELPESDFAAGGEATPLQSATCEAYARIFRLIDAQALPYLWRVWNYLADINREQFGLERYRQFNIGRQDAFIAAGRTAGGNVPAACALGLAAGPLSIAFMAGALPARPIENPRQVSAYAYPPEYGPRSPTFSRAALLYPEGQEGLFISGTASIVGHQTLHAGDVLAQCRETLANIAAVVAEANRLCRGCPFSLGELDYRVYLRHAEDFPAVAQLLLGLLPDAPRVIYVQADVCRSDLLLEIEAHALHPLDSKS